MIKHRLLSRRRLGGRLRNVRDRCSQSHLL